MGTLEKEKSSVDSLPDLNGTGKNGAEAPFIIVEKEPERVHLHKRVSLLNAITIIVGSVIGSGIFVSPTGILEITNSIGSALLVWVGCGVIALLGSLCYAELGTCVPKSGAEYAYLMEAFGPISAYLFGWTSVLIIRPSSCAIIASVFAEYVAKPFYHECDPPVYLIKLLAAVCIMIITCVNCYSVKWAVRMQDVFTYAKLACIAILSGIGIVELCRGEVQFFEDSFAGTNWNPGSLAMAFYIGLWAYDGWNSSNYCTEEMKNPKRDLPLSILIGIPLVTLCYLICNVAFITVLGKQGILESEAVALSLGDEFLGPMSWLIPILVAASCFGAVNGLAFTSGRLIYVAAREGHLPRVLALIHSKRFTPLTSLSFNSFIALIMLFPEASGFSTLIDFFSFAAWCFYGLCFAALLFLRWRQPDIERPYKIFIVVPVIMVFLSLFLMIAPITVNPLGSVIALVIIIAGLPFYFLFVKRYLIPDWWFDMIEKGTQCLMRILDLSFEDPDEVLDNSAQTTDSV